VKIVRVSPPVVGSFVPSFRNDAWMYQEIPANAAVDANSTAIVSNVVSQVNTFGPWINTWNYASQLVKAPANQPLVPVKLWRPGWTSVPGWAWALNQVMATGLPIPNDFQPNAGTDSEATFYQPDYVHPTLGLHGRYFEAWVLVRNTDPDAAQFPWKASWGGKAIGMKERFPGYFIDWFEGWPYPSYMAGTPGHPDSTYQDHNWGTKATSLPFLDLEISKDDVARGSIEHALGLAMVQSNGFRWPAQRYDDGVAGCPVQEGMRLFLPHDHVPVCTDPVARMIEECARRFGFVIDDHSGAVSFRAEPGALSSWSLAGFPWGSLKVLA
jgi:hypothetical protein